jgi:peroxiredoxin
MVMMNQLVPDFTLDSSEGVAVSPSQYRGRRNLVIAFIGAVPGAAMEWLDALATRADDLDEENARVLVLAEDTAEQTRALREELAAPFIFLADCDGAIHTRYGVKQAAVVITDRYGEVYSIHTDALPNPAEVIASLRHLNIMCDE